METLDDLAAAISLASAKVSVLKDDEVKLTYAKSDLVKELARLELSRDAVIAETKELVDAKESAERLLGEVEAKFIEAGAAFGALDEGLVMARKEMEAACATTIAESVKLSEIVSQCREAQSELDAVKAEAEAAKAAIEERKARIQDALATL